MINKLEFELEKINLQPEDILIIKVPKDTPEEVMCEFSDTLRDLDTNKHNLYVIVREGFEFTKATLEELKAAIDEKTNK